MKLILRGVSALVLLSSIYAISGRIPSPGNRLTLRQSYCKGATPCVLTAHNNNNRDGVNPNEGILKATTLSQSQHPIPRWLATTDAPIYAQPLYIHHLNFNGAAKNVVYVATEGNSVYMFDSDSGSATGAVLAQANLNNASDLGSGFTEIAVPYTDLPGACGLVAPEVGITGTPVIDVSVTPPVMYVVTKHEDADGDGVKTYRQKLHALYADTLQEVPGSPFIIDANFAANFAPAFNSLYNHQRNGLTLVPGPNGSAKIWVTWASNCDNIPYSGFAMEFTYSYSKAGFSNTRTIVNPAASCQAQPCQIGIWMGGAAPAADANGNIYLSTGNGADEFQGQGEYSNSILRLNDSGLQDYYSPPDFHALNVGNLPVACTNPNPLSCGSPCQLDTTGHYCQATLLVDDWDLAAGGVVLLSPTFNLTNPEIFAAGKQGMAYVAYANNLGHMDSQSANPDKFSCSVAKAPAPGAIAQCFQAFVLNILKTHTDSGMRGAPAFLAGGAGTQEDYLYVVGVEDTLKAYLLQNHNGVGTFDIKPHTPANGHVFTIGASPAVTWNNTKPHATNAIVWMIDASGAPGAGKPARPEVLYAYRAIPVGQNPDGSLGTPLWDTAVYGNSTPGNPGAVKFVVPTVVDGKIFLGGGAQGFEPASASCPVPTTSVQPTACGGLAMYR